MRPIWNQIFDESMWLSYYLPCSISRILVMEETDVPAERADIIISRVIPLGQRFYPSEGAFPLRE